MIDPRVVLVLALAAGLYYGALKLVHEAKAAEHKVAQGVQHILHPHQK